MRIEARLEKTDFGFRPVLFFPDEIERDKTIAAFTEHEGHNAASRAYMRQCKKPNTEAEFLACFQVLKRYAARAEAFAKL